MQKPLTVSDLNNQIKSLIESHYQNISVVGEVSRVTYHSSGHIYFSLKDKNSTISCVMFKSSASRLKFRIEEGLELVLNGSITLYTPRGSYQINVSSANPSGDGALSLAFEQLKKRLKEKGYFSEDIKKSLPKFPKRVAIVTSKTGAAIEDMKRVAKKRWPLLEIVVIDTTVQGESASDMIAKNIKIADSLKADIIIVGRGGGSIEDLWAFNEEIVADAIYEAKTPIVSAVGHEIDFVISDFCADLRAATPSNAMELILPDINEVLISLDTLYDQYNNNINQLLYKKSQELTHTLESLKRFSIDSKISRAKESIDAQKEEFKRAIDILISHKKRLLDSLFDTYKSIDPKNRDKIGYAQVLKDGELISLESLKDMDEISLLNSKVKVEAKVGRVIEL